MPNSALHGRLRDLALNEVLQLLAFGRKSGTLRLEAPVVGRRARVELSHGSITDARLWTVDEVEPHGERTVADILDVQRVLFEILRWRDGQFRFEAATPASAIPPGVGGMSLTPDGHGLRLTVDPILVEADRRAERWARIADRVPHTEVVPAFAATNTTALPLLRLSPSQWEALTRVDGQRDLQGLATVLQRDVMDVADCVYDLLTAGVLTLREAAVVPRRNPTPPAVLAVPDPMRPPTPPVTEAGGGVEEPDDDSLFDPAAYQEHHAYGTPASSRVTPSVWQTVAPVALNPFAPSIPQEQESVIPPDWHGPALCRFGDDLARRGDLRGALAYWHAALRAMVPVADSERVREAIALVTRLLALLQS